MSFKRAPSGLLVPSAVTITGHNVTSTAITAPEKRGFFLGCTSSDGSVNALIWPAITGWQFQMLAMFPDSTGSQHVAAWIGRPVSNLVTSASGTTCTWTNSTVGAFANGALRQYYGTLKGEVVDIAGGQAASATSLLIGRPTTAATPRYGRVIGLACVVFQSGGVGITASADAAWPNGVDSALASFRVTRDITTIVNSGTTFSAGRSARWNGGYIVLR